MRKKLLLNSGWTFEKDKLKTVVDLPHTWNDKDGQTGPSDYYRGTCTYEKELVISDVEEEEEFFLEFEGVNSEARVFFNGVEAIYHEGGYSIFRADVTPYVKEKNLIRVEVSNAPNNHVYPQKADFTFYGGIYRSVHLIRVQKSHFDLSYYGSQGFTVTPTVKENGADLTFDTYTCGNGDRVDILLNDEVVLSSEISDCHTSLFYHLDEAHLWDGLSDPYLYQAEAKLYEKEELKDTVHLQFGIRSYYFDSEKGFFLNGRSYPLHGVSRHQDRINVGNALTKEMHEEDLSLILSMGANAIRLAHYQHDQYFYDLCDEKGVITWAEIPYITVHMPSGRENTISQMKELIAQNHHHPSIICYAMSNEITLNGVTEDLLENHRVLNDLIHRMDPTRVSAMANLFMLETDSPLVSLPDICGYNLYYGWYVGDMEDNDAFFDKFHKEHPKTIIGLTEYGADSVINLQSPKPEKGDYTESYQALYHEHMLEMFSTRPYLFGTFCWNMFEFAAAGRNEAGDPGKNHKGLVTFDRQTKKDAFYIYKAWWSNEPFVHLTGKRYRNRIEPVTEVKVYSNRNKISLYVDDVLFDTVEGTHVFRFQVPISGIHKIIAVSEDGFKDEMEICKVEEPDPSYFMSKEKVKNWFDEEEKNQEDDEYLSIYSSMAEIKKTEEGSALLDHMMKSMMENAAGGMGKTAAIPESMMAMIMRQPLIKLMKQGGLGTDAEQVKALDLALRKIKKQ